MAKTRECCGALSLRRTGDDLHVSLHKGFKIRLAGIVPVFIEFTGEPRPLSLPPVWNTDAYLVLAVRPTSLAVA